MEKKIGITLATYRKDKKMSQIELADKLRNYGINVSNAAISAWEKDISSPNAHQVLALCKILGITDIYNEFIGFNPDDPLAKLNEEGKEKALEYIGLLLLSEQFQKKESTIIPFRRPINGPFFRHQPALVNFLMMKTLRLLKWAKKFRKKQTLDWQSMVTVWSLATMTIKLYGYSRLILYAMAR